MSQMISIVNKSRKDAILRGKPKIAAGVIWRRDGEDNQIIVLSREGLALPLILNPTAAKIFSLCNGKNSIEDIAGALSKEFKTEDFALLLKDAQEQIAYFTEKKLVEA